MQTHRRKRRCREDHHRTLRLQRGRFDELGPVVSDAVDPGANNPWREGGFGQGVEQVLDIVLVGQVGAEPISEPVPRDDDRGPVVDVPYLGVARG